MNANEIVEFINEVLPGRSKILDENDNEVYVVNSKGYKGIAIAIEDNVSINENFNKISIINCALRINGNLQNVIFLNTTDETMSDHFAYLIQDFISKKNREIIKSKPMLWYEEWADLMGNVKSNKRVYDIIGEMKTLIELHKLSLNPKWESMNCGTYDITTDNAFYEVKTTKKKLQELITVHNQFQLDFEHLNKPLYVAFCKVEENELGDSIDSLLKELVELGFDKCEINSYLDKKGFAEGKISRDSKYLVNEIRLYEVDDNFPKITCENFVDGKIPNGVVNYEYTVSLTGLQYKKIL